MLIDWFTVGAQVLNFLVLVYLLKRFLYGPIIRAMDEREKKIALRLQEGKKQQELAEQERSVFEEKTKALDRERDKRLSEITHEVEQKRHAMMHEVREAVDADRVQWYGVLEREKDAFLQDLRLRAGQHAYAVARHALLELANADLESHVVRVFEERLQQLDVTESARFKEAIQESQGKALLRSAFPLSQDTVRGITTCLETLAAGPVDVTLETAPDIICGLELIVHGRKIAWSVEEYLDSLETALPRAFEPLIRGVQAGKNAQDLDAKDEKQTQAEVAPSQDPQ
jgi:F-type H+-transporting ATPase subunit b